jgi:hypothetical protein
MPISPTSSDSHRSRRRTRARSLLATVALALSCCLLIATSALGGVSHRPAASARRLAASKHCAVSASRLAGAASGHGRSSAARLRAARRCTNASSKRSRGGHVIGPLSSSGLIVSAEGGSVASPSPSEGPAPGESTTSSRHQAGGGQPGETGGQATPAATPLPEETNGVLTDPIDTRYLTRVPFGSSSFWLQPWRAYFDTWPASTLTSSLGINFNVAPADAEAVAQLLQDSGFTLARREVPWSALSYEDPTRFVNETKIRTILSAMHNHGLRPLILLNANSGQPGPARPISLTTLSPAPVGATTVTLDEASASSVVPGKTGFDELTFGTGPDILVTSVSPAGLATLSQPLRKPLPAGKHRAMTLRYAPFEAPKLANGEPNPVFQETLDGWLSYVATVSREAASIFGPEGYDLEVWNELSFGSQFLNYEHYYHPPAESSSGEEGAEAPSAEPPNAEAASAQAQAAEGNGTETEESPETRDNSEALEHSEAEVTPEAEAEAEAGPATSAQVKASVQAGAGKAVGVDKEVTKKIRSTLLKETVAYVRDPAHGIPAGVGISNGFASQTPFPSGADAPLGLTALSKHLYNGARSYPSGYPERSIRPVNALGFKDTEPGAAFKPLFIPTYQSLFPELYLTATNTETITRDIAPITTNIYKLPHGRYVGPAGGSPVQKWMTEYNLGANKGTPVGPDGVTPANVTLTAADKAHFQAKALLRSLVAMINKGMTREYFFAAAPGALSLVGKSFYSALEAQPGTYPGDQLGGETMTGFRNLFSQFQGPGPEGAARQLTLTSIAQEGNHSQFSGDGTAAHPDLYDRDVLAVLPFQSSPTHFVIPVYVMTRDLLTLYDPSQPASDVNRFDLPNETFRITLGNLPETSQAPSVSAYDPLRGESTPAKLLSRAGNTAEFEFAATDYPRLLNVEYPGA